MRTASLPARGGAAALLVHLGMLCASLAFASWWTSHTILDTARTRRVADAVLENTTLRHFVAAKIASVTAPAVATPASATAATNAADEAALANRLDLVLDRPAVRAELEQFVVDAHDELIGKSTTSAVLDRPTVTALVTAAMPGIRPVQAAKLHAITFAAPQVAVLSASRNALADRFWLYAGGAALLVALAIAASSDRHSTVQLVGKWLLGISVAHLVVLWIVPVLIVPHVTDNPWAGVVTALARALGAGLVTSLVVLATAGLVFVFADRFVAREPAMAGAS